jgi:hypothetical protein
MGNLFVHAVNLRGEGVSPALGSSVIHCARWMANVST